MSKTLSSHLRVTLETSRVAFDPSGAGTLPCRACEHPLDIHQPEPDDPNLLLGTCPDCGDWFAIGIGGADALVVSLPMIGLLRDALAPSGPEA